MSARSILWWGRFDPDYSRNRILRAHLAEMGLDIIDFFPKSQAFANLEARLKRVPKTDLVWVPCFRQRDFGAAHKWAKAHKIPLVFDPLISAYDKQVFERKKAVPNSSKAKKLLKWEKTLFQKADVVVADTLSHAQYFQEQFNISEDKTRIVYVGAEETVFNPVSETSRSKTDQASFDVLFYGSFIPLQGPEIIIKAAAIYDGPPACWTLIGDGPLRAGCERLNKELGGENVVFKDWVEYQKELPAEIAKADILLGIFGTTPKAGRVIPNKVFQSMAMAMPVITRSSDAYPDTLKSLTFIDAGRPEQLAEAVKRHLSDSEGLAHVKQGTYEDYQTFFSASVIKRQLASVILTGLKAKSGSC